MSWVHGGTGTTSHKEKNTHTLTTFGATAFTAEAVTAHKVVAKCLFDNLSLSMTGSCGINCS